MSNIYKYHQGVMSSTFYHILRTSQYLVVHKNTEDVFTTQSSPAVSTTATTLTSTSAKTTTIKLKPMISEPQCVNRWRKRYCSRQLSNGRCSKWPIRRRCNLTCGVCCGDLWANKICRKKKWACGRNLNVRKNCKKTCKKC